LRVLVVGTTPPPGGDSAIALAGEVNRLRALGDDVEVLSPDARSAAHLHGRLSTLALPLRLLRLAPRYDALVLRIAMEMPLGERTGRLVRAATLTALGVATGRYGTVTLRLDSPIPIPGGVGGRATARLWRSASQLVVATEADRRQLLRAPGVVPDRVKVADTMSGVATSRGEASWPRADESDLRERVLAEIRRRAQGERRANDARVELGALDIGPRPGNPFGAVPTGKLSLYVMTKASVRRVLRSFARRVGRSR
jgi:hypothetical protein